MSRADQQAAVDWSRWRKCPVCSAETGEPCTSLTGATAENGYKPQAVSVPTDKPHGGRKPRTGGA